MPVLAIAHDAGAANFETHVSIEDYGDAEVATTHRTMDVVITEQAIADAAAHDADADADDAAAAHDAGASCRRRRSQLRDSRPGSRLRRRRRRQRRRRRIRRRQLRSVADYGDADVADRSKDAAITEQAKADAAARFLRDPDYSGSM